MSQPLSILTILIAIALVVFDVTVLRHRRVVTGARGFERGVYLLFVLALLLTTISSIVPLALGSHMAHWLLILHMLAAPLFAICAALLALLWANLSRWTIETWLVITGSFLTVLSAMFGMMSWFGSDTQHWLLNVHGISSMVVVIGAAGQAGRMLASPSHAARAGH